MAKEPKTRYKASRRRTNAERRRWRQKLMLGGAILVLVIGIGVVVRSRQQSQILPRLPDAVDRHYTRGTAGAPVVVKEFSDYG